MALMEQEVAFFGKYGFGNVLLVVFGAAQIAGGAMLIFSKTRFVGAVFVALTFAVSAVLLILDGNVGLAFVTLVALGLLGMTMKHASTLR